MNTQDLSRQLFWAAMIVIAMSGAASVTPLLAQQVQSSPTASAPSATLRGPRLSAEFQRYEPAFARRDASASSSVAVAQGSHTIVISTLALVLIIVLIVLLI